MKNGAKYDVQTRWGWFRLDEGAYRDYLAGRLWICWEPGKPQSAPEDGCGRLPVSDEARALFISGAMDPNSDADWQTYLDNMEANGLSTALEVYQEAYDLIK